MTRLSFNLDIRRCRCIISTGWRHLWLLSGGLLWQLRLPPWLLVWHLRLLLGSLGLAHCWCCCHWPVQCDLCCIGGDSRCTKRCYEEKADIWFDVCLISLTGFVNSLRRVCTASWKSSNSCQKLWLAWHKIIARTLRSRLMVTYETAMLQAEDKN